MPFADFYPFSSFLDAVEIHIREKAAEANGGSRPVVTQGQEHRRSMFEPAVVAFLTSLRDEGRLGATGSVGEIGRAHVGTPVTNAHLVCRLLLEKKKTHVLHELNPIPNTSNRWNKKTDQNDEYTDNVVSKKNN